MGPIEKEMRGAVDKLRNDAATSRRSAEELAKKIAQWTERREMLVQEAYDKDAAADTMEARIWPEGRSDG